MRRWLPQRPLTGPEIVGVVVAAFMLLPLLIGGLIALVTAISTLPVLVGLIAGAVGALGVHYSLTKNAIISRRRIAELERENLQLTDQVARLESAVDRYIDRGGEPG